MDKRIGIIGAGVVGTAAGLVLYRNGCEITGVFDMDPESTKKLAGMLRCSVKAGPEEVSDSADILFITTSDNAIRNVAANIADCRAFHPDQIIIHMSGVLPSDVLGRAKAFGAHILSLHPLQTFAGAEQAISNLPGSIFSVEGDEAAYDTARELVGIMGGEIFILSKGSKSLYHAGACVVSNYLVTLIAQGINMLAAAGMEKSFAARALMPLIKGTVNNLEKVGIPQALTGPIARGDNETVAQHLLDIEQRLPELKKMYMELGQLTVALALEKGTIDNEAAQKITFILGGED